METFKKEYLPCVCGRKNYIKKEHFDAGFIDCTHPGCTHRNIISKKVYYDSSLLAVIKDFGKLVYLNKPSISYLIQKPVNVVGRSTLCDISIASFIHDEKCFISNRHCTIQIIFDVWTGKLRYTLLDGAQDSTTLKHKNSLNGTMINGYSLRENEIIDIPSGGIISLGGKDEFRIEGIQISIETLESYKIIAASINPDMTQ